MDFTSPAILLIDFQTLLPVKSNIFFHENTRLIDYRWSTGFIFYRAVFHFSNSTQQYGTGGDLYSIYQKMLKGHTYKTFKTTPGTLECSEACLSYDRCHSFNFVMFIAICELNNRTKEVRPEDFVKDENRCYMAKGPKRGNRT